MRLALCAAQVPFVRGGAEFHCDSIYRELIRRGHEVEYIKIPYKWYPPQEIINHCLAWRLLDLTESNGKKIDGVIATKFPSYVVKHQNKVVWLLHQMRSAYDLAHTTFDDLAPYGKIGEIIREKIYSMDKSCLEESKKIYTNSKNVSNRLWKFNKIKGETLYHPPPFIGRYYCDSYEDYIFYPSRLESVKRQDLLISSMKYLKSNVRLKIAGTGPQLEYYRNLAKKCKVEDKVDFLGYISDEELLENYAKSMCVAYVPFEEDMGYVTLEGFLSKKPIITCNDSAGPLEFVENGINGYIIEPSPEKIAERIDWLYQESIYKQMGEKGYSKIMDMNLSWDNVIDRLTGSM